MARSRILTVKILTDAADAQKGLTAATGQYSKFSQALGRKSATTGTKAGDYLVSGIDKVLGTGLKIAGGAGATILGAALFKGFRRLKDIDAAKASLRGLGHSTEEVEAIMKNARTAVDDTKYALGDMAGVAGTMVAAGVKPGKQLEDTLKGVADSAFIGKSSIGEMGQIWGKVAASNKVSGREVNQLLQRQIPILQLLGDQYGVSADEARKMVSRGEVDFQNFAAAMKKGMGGAALESGKTFEGAWDNTMAALGRIGANILEPLFGKFTGGLNGVKDGLKSLEPAAAQFGQTLADMVGWVQRNIALFITLGKIAGVVVGALLAFRAVVAVMQAYQAVMAVVRVAQAAYVASSYGAAGASYALTAATNAQRAAYVVAVGAQKAVTAGQWLLNAAMSANPIGLVVVAIVALIAVFALLWTKNKTFRDFVIGMWKQIKAAAAAVWAWLKQAGQVTIQALIGYVRLITAPYRLAFQGIKAAAQAVFGWFRSGGPGQAIQWLIGAARTIASPFVAAFNRVRAAASAVFSWLRSAWSSVWAWATSYVRSQITAAVAVVRGIQAAIGAVVSWLRSAWSSVWSWASSRARSALDAILGPVRAVRAAFGAVVSVVRQVIDFIKQLKFPSPPGWLSKVVGGSAAIPSPPGFTPAGAALAPAAVWRPVASLAAPSRSGHADGAVVYEINISGALDPDAVARQVQQLLTGQRRRAGLTVLNRRVA